MIPSESGGAGLTMLAVALWLGVLIIAAIMFWPRRRH